MVKLNNLLQTLDVAMLAWINLFGDNAKFSRRYCPNTIVIGTSARVASDQDTPNPAAVMPRIKGSTPS